jgi:hypothetical protein
VRRDGQRNEHALLRVTIQIMTLEGLHGESDEGVEAAWAEEIERRIRQIDSGEIKTISWEEVRAKLYARLHVI